MTLIFANFSVPIGMRRATIPRRHVRRANPVLCLGSSSRLARMVELTEIQMPVRPPGSRRRGARRG